MRKILAAFFLWLSLASSASADISFVSAGPYTDNANSGTTLSTTFTVSSSQNRILVVFAYNNDSINTPATTITYNGVSLAGPYGGISTVGSTNGFYILVNPPSGANTLLLTNTNCSGPNCFLATLPAEYAGAAQTSQPDTTGAFTTDSVVEDTYSSTVGPTITNRAWIIGLAESGGGGTPADSMSAPFTARINGGSGSFAMMGDSGTITPAGTATFTATIQNSGSDQRHYSFSIAAALVSDKGSMMLMGCCR